MPYDKRKANYEEKEEQTENKTQDYPTVTDTIPSNNHSQPDAKKDGKHRFSWTGFPEHAEG